ncbi:MAG TPA: type VI secretion system-associated FHA domain protein TagH [Steroidobacteraceae bacterium]|jgi:type VI secretion system FHA domain protein|nr:type VI secretion system-associated FHA domain protein TagH [Steroidobacteraceae bacterium]
MTLRLRVVSDQRRSLADRCTAVFSVEGGTIGRSADNDWVLPDPLRYVSAHHARVQFREGHFYLQDVSTNGVYVNDDMEPLAKRGSSGYRLVNGDVLRIGEYHIVAALESQRAAAAAEDPAAAAVPTSIHALRTFGHADRDIGAVLNLDELLVPEPRRDPVLPVNAYGQAIESAPVRALASEVPLIEAEAPPPAQAPDPEAEAHNERMARLAEAVAREPKNGNGAMALADVSSGLDAFCRGAGLDAERLPADAQTRLLHLAGRLFREALVGLKDLERSRDVTRNRYRIELPVREKDDPRPSLADSMVEDLLIGLLVQHESRRLDSVQWLREVVDEAKQHENATAQATRAAFVEFLDRLDPAELEARFERAARRGKARAADKAQYWELFVSFYRNLIEMPADHLPHTFVEAFSSAYREAMKKTES